ncbi:MAG: hypothetical protein AB1626_00105 [Candidatus Micrarchaeota archaeon]
MAEVRVLVPERGKLAGDELRAKVLERGHFIGAKTRERHAVLRHYEMLDPHLTELNVVKYTGRPADYYGSFAAARPHDWKVWATARKGAREPVPLWEALKTATGANISAESIRDLFLRSVGQATGKKPADVNITGAAVFFGKGPEEGKAFVHAVFQEPPESRGWSLSRKDVYDFGKTGTHVVQSFGADSAAQSYFSILARSFADTNTPLVFVESPQALKALPGKTARQQLAEAREAASAAEQKLVEESRRRAAAEAQLASVNEALREWETQARQTQAANLNVGAKLAELVKEHAGAREELKAARASHAALQDAQRRLSAAVAEARAVLRAARLGRRARAIREALKKLSS